MHQNDQNQLQTLRTSMNTSATNGDYLKLTKLKLSKDKINENEMKKRKRCRFYPNNRFRMFLDLIIAL